MHPYSIWTLKSVIMRFQSGTQLPFSCNIFNFKIFNSQCLCLSRMEEEDRLSGDENEFDNDRDTVKRSAVPNVRLPVTVGSDEDDDEHLNVAEGGNSSSDSIRHLSQVDRQFRGNDGNEMGTFVGLPGQRSRSLPPRQEFELNSNNGQGHSLDGAAAFEINQPGTSRSNLDDSELDFEGAGASLNGRDPNYATQRPDTLGAINLVSQNPIRSFVDIQPQASARVRGGDTPEDMIFEDVMLGQRTRGAGMDQLELNLHQLSISSDDDVSDEGSDSGEPEPDSNQCESTEADQYKMNPEADQSETTASPANHGNQVVEDEVEEEDTLEESGNANSGRIANRELSESAEDDRQFLGNHIGWNSHQPGVAKPRDLMTGFPKNSQSNDGVADQRSSLPKQTPQSSSSASASQLRHHPHSAFSQPNDGRRVNSHSVVKPNLVSGSHAAALTGIKIADKKLQNGKSSVKDNAASVFKPIDASKSETASHSNWNAAVPLRQNYGLPAFVDNHKNQPEPNLEHLNGRRWSEDERCDPLDRKTRLSNSNPNIVASSSIEQFQNTRESSGWSLLKPHPAEPALGIFGNTCCFDEELVDDGQMTPPRHSRPYQMLDDSLDMSPIRPPSSATSQNQPMHSYHSPNGYPDELKSLNRYYSSNSGHPLKVFHILKLLYSAKDIILFQFFGLYSLHSACNIGLQCHHVLH